MTHFNKFSIARSVAVRVAGGLSLFAVAGFSGPKLLASPSLADISVNLQIVGPPPPRHEVIIEGNRPGPDFVWVGGYWDGAPGQYSWVGGHWDRPPHPHSHWVAPRWEPDHDGHLHQVRGEWRD
jgi:hypothetical protein